MKDDIEITVKINDEAMARLALSVFVAAFVGTAAGALLFGCVGGSDGGPSGPPPGSFWTECEVGADGIRECSYHQVGLVYDCVFANSVLDDEDLHFIDDLKRVCAGASGDGVSIASVDAVETEFGPIVCEHNGTEWKPGCTYECVDTGRRCETVDGEVVW